MAELVFAAHDPGAARMLVAIADPSRKKGLKITFLGAGPAVDVWRLEGETVIAVDADFERLPGGMVERTGLLVTGTGFTDFEKNLWQTFRSGGVASLGAIDSWSNFQLRFAFDSGRGATVQPDAIAVIDDKSRRRIEEGGWYKGQLFVVGQPHLEAFVPRIRRLREQKKHPSSEPKKLVFFSEPIEEDYGRERRGFNQFEVAKLIIDSLAEAGYEQTVEIKKHPRESADKWQSWAVDRGMKVILSNRSVDDLLIEADGVLGMTTMSLIEASLVGIPTLSLQPGRREILNPVIDDMVAVVAEPDKAVDAVKLFMTNLFAQSNVKPDMKPMIKGSASRFIDAIEKMMVAETIP